MAQILFGQSYYLRFDPKLWEAMQPYPPLGTMYAAAFLRARGYEVALFDAMLASSEEEWAAALDETQPQYAVIYEDNFNYLSKMCLLRMRQAAFTMIEMARARGCTVIVAGSDASDHARLYLASGAHFVLIGEGERTLAELLDHLTGRSHMPLDQILGLAFLRHPERPSSSDLIITPRRPDIKDVDSLPFPAWDLVDVERYRGIWRERHGYYSMNMVTTRGCPYHCNWCAKPIWGQRYNARSPENVVAELKWLKQTYHPDHIWFADDIVGLKPGWWTRFAELVAQEDALVPFKCLSRVDLLLRQGEVEAMKRAGCDIVWVGAESGSQKILDAMEKGTRVEQIYQATELLHRHGVRVGFFLQFGYPGETREDIEKTLQMVRDCQPDDIGMSVSYPLPGTKFYERVKDQLGVKQNWQDSEDLAMLYHGPYATEFYRQLHVTLHKEYRARKYARRLARVALHPRRWRKGHLRQVAAMIYHWTTLPLARRKLARLEKLPHRGLGALPPGMSQTAAATPTPQN
ncbi:MAG: B12-binding domain-containing radical SAM protein [Chloroflexi bacterium]|nr:B12-binding domain-containing radical SAM protein [Chloroflexota bacterium]